jgi:uncharacterized protein
VDFDEYNEKQLILRVNCEMNLLRSVFWHSLVYPGRESFRLFRTSQGFEFNGQVVLTPEDKPFSVNYQVCCDALWYTRAVSIEVNEGYKSRKLQFDVDDEQRWRINGVEDEWLRGCVDVDLSVTPATNTLPLRRLDLQLGVSHELVAVWVRFPQLEVARLAQRYTRLKERLYRYESRSGAFTALVEVDELGLVIDYEGMWVRGKV